MARIPGSELVAIGLEDGSIEVREMEADRVRWKTILHRGCVTALAVAPDGATVLSAGIDGTIRNASLDNGSEVGLIAPKTETIGITRTLAYSSGGTYFLSGGDDTHVRLWRALDCSIVRTYQGHLATVNSVAFVNGESSAASCGWDGTVKLWRVPGETKEQ
jgi:WD40 repeat protein